jgi:hypothetical protein
MLRYAIEFYAAGLVTDDALGYEHGYEVIAPITVNYLIGHAIELGLKAYLLHVGFSLDHIRYEIGHDLQKGFDRAMAKGLNKQLKSEDGDSGVLRVMNALYSSKQFEYIETGAKTFPVFGSLQSFAKRVLLSVAQSIEDGSRLLSSKAGEILLK